MHFLPREHIPGEFGKIVPIVGVDHQLTIPVKLFMSAKMEYPYQPN
jgi:hypothetical protein